MPKFPCGLVYLPGFCVRFRLYMYLILLLNYINFAHLIAFSYSTSLLHGCEIRTLKQRNIRRLKGRRDKIHEMHSRIWFITP